MHICLKEISQSEDAIVTQLTNQKLGTLPLSPGSTPTLFLITGIPGCPLTVPQNKNLSRSTTQRWLSMLSSRIADGRVFNCEDDRSRTGVKMNISSSNRKKKGFWPRADTKITWSTTPTHYPCVTSEWVIFQNSVQATVLQYFSQNSVRNLIAIWSFQTFK